MANRDYRKIERTIRDFCMNISGSGGIVSVKKLPEVGEEGVVYQTPDGKMWACKNTTETEIICDLKVSKSFKLKDKVLARDVVGLCDTLGEGQWPFTSYIDERVAKTIIAIKVSPEDTGSVQYIIGYTENDDGVETGAAYFATDIPLTDMVDATLNGLTEVPSVEITQMLVANLFSNKLELLDIAFLFKDGSHTETTTTSTWTEIGAPSGQANIFFQWYDGANFDGVSIDDIVLKVNGEVVELTEIMSETDRQKSFTGISTETLGEITIEVNIEGRISAEYAYNFAFVNKQTVAFSGNVGTISGSVPIIIYLSTRNLF